MASGKSPAHYLGMAAEREIIGVLQTAADRGLRSILIGANAIVLLGYIRNTIDLDLLVPEQERPRWLDLLRELGYQLYHGSETFAQFEAAEKDAPPVDLMFVEQQTWQKLIEGAKEMPLGNTRVLVPRPEYLVALKLHAASSPKSIGKISVKLSAYVI